MLGSSASGFGHVPCPLNRRVMTFSTIRCTFPAAETTAWVDGEGRRLVVVHFGYFVVRPLSSSSCTVAQKPVRISPTKLRLCACLEYTYNTIGRLLTYLQFLGSLDLGEYPIETVELHLFCKSINFNRPTFGFYSFFV